MATKNKKRPLRWAKNWMAEVPGVAGRMILLTVAIVVLGLLFSMLQGIETDWLRIAITCVIIAAGLVFFFVEGVNKGSGDAANSRQMAKLEKAGKVLGSREDASCYHPLKALCGAFLLFAVPIVLAVIVAFNAKEYTYVLQDLPTWLTGSYASREDVLGPLGAYTQMGSAGVVEWLRVVSRLFMLSFVGLFSDPQRMGYMIDRLSPLFIALYPLAYTLGYLRGPAEQEKLQKLNKKAKKIAVRKQQKSNLVNELLGDTNVPHYGHKNEKDKPKKKELI